MAADDVDPAAEFFAQLALFIFAVALNGATMIYSWGWFIAPLGLPKLGFAHALGMAAMLRFYCQGPREPRKIPLWVGMATSVGHNLVMLAFGWTLTWFI